MPEMSTKFDWRIFADATFAGLSVLIPIPIIDSIFEGFFRRRMPGAIARARNRKVSEETLKQLGQGEGCSPVGCLVWPFKQLFNLLKKISKKILYFLTIKEATDMVSYYWHRAYLIDYMLAEGHIADEANIVVARRTLATTLSDTDTSPVVHLARQVVGNTHHILRSLWGVARRKQQDDMLTDHQTLMGDHWSEYADYWERLTGRFEQTLVTERALWEQAEMERALAAAQQVAPPGAAPQQDEQE